MIGGVADNFSRLIAAIEAEANGLSQQWPDAATGDPLRRIAATAGSAAGLTHQLLALVRRHPMRAHPLDLNLVVESQAGVLGRLAGKKIALEKICWAKLPPVMADRKLVEQILSNLVLNARDAMPNGGSVTVSTTLIRVDEAHARRNKEARPGAYVCLTVSDTGCGMAPEVQARLFEPFFTTKDAGKSAGLGLATVHGLVKQHSGWIEVSSQPGAGSRFSVYFPCAQISAASAAKDIAPPRGKSYSLSA